MISSAQIMDDQVVRTTHTMYTATPLSDQSVTTEVCEATSQIAWLFQPPTASVAKNHRATTEPSSETCYLMFGKEVVK